MSAAAIWHGGIQEWTKLDTAISNHCECADGKPACAAHAMLIDQKRLDGLLFARRIRGKLLKEEWRRCANP